MLALPLVNERESFAERSIGKLGGCNSKEEADNNKHQGELKAVGETYVNMRSHYLFPFVSDGLLAREADG